jgi:hypothetical protein
MDSSYKEQKPSALVDIVSLHRVLAGYRRAYEEGQITAEELERFTTEAEQAHGWNSGTCAS